LHPSCYCLRLALSQTWKHAAASCSAFSPKAAAPGKSHTGFTRWGGSAHVSAIDSPRQGRVLAGQAAPSETNSAAEPCVPGAQRGWTRAARKSCGRRSRRRDASATVAAHWWGYAVSAAMVSVKCVSGVRNPFLSMLPIVVQPASQPCSGRLQEAVSRIFPVLPNKQGPKKKGWGLAVFTDPTGRDAESGRDIEVGCGPSLSDPCRGRETRGGERL
jgi:hypothetical protein